MKTRTLLAATSLIAASIFVMTPAHATNIVWDFGPLGGSGDLTQSHNYTSSGWTINAQAFGPNTPHLFGKNDGGDEIGLGLTNDPSGQHEITSGSFIQLDLALLNLSSNVISFQAGSTTTGGANNGFEGWQIRGSNTAGTLGATLIDSCTASASVNCEGHINDIGYPGGFRYLDITSITNGNVLLSSLDANVSAVPGPVVGAGLPGLVAAFGGLLAWKRRRQKVVG